MGYIKDGKYIKGKPPVEPVLESSTYKSWDHQVQRDNHRRDLIQPYNEKGEFSEEFIDQYLLKNQELADQYGFNPGEENE